MSLITEHKRDINGKLVQFECSSVLLNGERAILQYIWLREKPYRDGPVYLPAGAIHTDAFYWSDRNYLIYRLTSQDGKLYGHRIDVCEDVVITNDSIHWQDLVLDFWIDPKGIIHVLDEEEFAEAFRDRKLTQKQFDIVNRTREFLLQQYHSIISSLEGNL